MCIGTWKQSVEKKKASIDKTHLSLDSKERIKDLLDSIWAKTCRKEYINCSEDGSNPSIGMFGTGFYSFHNTSVSETRDFITMCIDILEMNDDEEIYKRAEKTLNKGISGMAAGSASMILHCLKPYSFPIINGNYNGETIYPLLGVTLNKQKNLKTYIDNCRKIKAYIKSI